MKINITIEATPEEVRETVGLPDISSLQALLMGKITERVKEGNMDPDSIMEMINPKTNIWSKLFMDTAMKNFEMMTSSVKKPGKKDEAASGQNI